MLNILLGCDVTVVGSGEIASPGYGSTRGYANMSSCTWTVQAPAGVDGLTLLFEDYSIHSSDKFKVNISRIKCLSGHYTVSVVATV